MAETTTCPVEQEIISPKDNGEKPEEQNINTNLQSIKIDVENLDELLKTKVKLSDGTEQFMFSRGPDHSEAKTGHSINCHLCRVANMTNNESLKNHLNGRKHTEKMKKVPKAENFNAPFLQYFGRNEDGTLKQFSISPGENILEVTPEYEERISIKKPWSYQLSDDPELVNEPIHEYNVKNPILGLLYIFKMKSNKGIKYFCSLCNVTVRKDIYPHLIGANHQATYILKHFPELYKYVRDKLEKHSTDSVENEQRLRMIFRKLYKKIEDVKGLHKISMIDSNDFSQCHNRYVNFARRLDHYNEKTIVINKDEVNALVNKVVRNINVIRNDVNSLDKPQTGTNTLNQVKRANTQNSNETPRKRVRRELTNDPQTWNKYRILLGEYLEDLDYKFKNYERFPKSHPFYEEQWRSFWFRRCNELKRDNINPRSYSFDQEWEEYWIQRLQRLYVKDLSKLKFDLKRKLNLPFNERSPSPIRPSAQQLSPIPPPAPSMDNSSRYSNRPLNDETPIIPSEPLSVISVLRLLTALEDQLGSLGLNAVQLLSRAILYQKSDKNPNELLKDNDVYVFFITVKEKLAGQIIANVVDRLKIPVVKRTIEDIATMLQLYEEYMEREKKNNRNIFENKSLRGNNSTVSGINPGNSRNGNIWNSGAYPSNISSITNGNNLGGTTFRSPPSNTNFNAMGGGSGSYWK